MKRDEYAIRAANSVYQHAEEQGHDLRDAVSVLFIAIVAIAIFYTAC
jgi:hypothetical protein